ncbi:virB8 family protein [Rickettsiella endosymbiont of Dermanyssus gallinae]|uniref:virB8 family protein n=1 Tax=Rickettsiella endosymbiont of Dermanyssus gallinae TaxID=2856608 RepID=UPI001C52A0B2|nr:type IV secretion system protein [Rickettsiella endosymbiont of Dermanyssus gallinae]
MRDTKEMNSDLKEVYYQTAADWRYDIYQSKTLWLHYSLIGNAGLLLALLLALLTLACLVPLKQKVPYLYAFNHATGEITKLGELEPSHLSANWQMTRFFLIHYVINRESYDSDYLEEPYQLAWAQSSATIRQQYDAEVDSQAKTSPYQKYGKNKAIKIPLSQVSVSPLNDHTAVIRFEKQLRDKSTHTQQIAYEEAIVKWQYQSVKATQTQLDRNPLGFTVTYYQVTPVTLSAEEGK